MITISTYPTFKAITVDEIKRYSRITISEEDTLVGELIDRAMIHLYRETSHISATTTFKVTQSDWTDMYVDIFPYASIASVKYYDSNNTLQTLDSANYRVFDGVYPWKVEFTSSPTLFDRPDAIQVNAVCGYTEGNCPDDYKHVLAVSVATWYEVRQGIVIGTIATEVPRTLEFAVQAISKRIEV